MRNHNESRTMRLRLSFPALGLAALAISFPALAERPVKRVPPEVAIGGLTVAQEAARQRAVHTQLSAHVPPGLENAPVRVQITQKDKADLAIQPPVGTGPQRIGVVKTVPVAAGKPVGQDFASGTLVQAADGSFTWAVSVTSPEAASIRVHLTDVSLPENTELYFMGANGQVDGPYTGTGRDASGDFWTRSVFSESGTIVIRYVGNSPDVDRPRMSFVISEVAHIQGKPPRPDEQNHDSWPCSDNAACLVDVNCTNTGPAAPAEDAVAKMDWIQGAFVNTCSGGLLADTDSGSQIPYFLTANHCLSASNSNVQTFFNYTTTSCNGGCPDSLVSGGTPPPASTVGVTLVATGAAGDFTLLTLNQAPPAGATYLGWNNAPIANTNGANLYRISNANFGPQVYSQHQVDTGSPTCSGWPRGERIYSTDITGATMGGSSGSPVVNSAGDVVGQLSGCCGFNCGDECDSGNNWTVDGALAYYWGSVSAYLDPSSPPVCDNNGSCGPGENCNNCPGDCRAKTGGNPNSRYCCDGDVPGCGNAACAQDGWSCGGGGGGCSNNAECDDGQFCNGVETCSAGSCQNGTDPCPGQNCNESTDQCVSCGGNKAPCSTNADCCSNNCKGGSCKGG